MGPGSRSCVARLEATPRGVYTGILGYACPRGDACFSVAIRTAQIVKGDLLYGTGGGITYASDPASEWEECLAKMEAFSARKDGAEGGRPVHPSDD